MLYVFYFYVVGKFIKSMALTSVEGINIVIEQLGTILFRHLHSYQKITLPDGRIFEGPDKILGSGSFGTVYRYKLDKDFVAVKVPHDNQRSLCEELKVLQKANRHINIIKLIGPYKLNHKICIVTELMSGSLLSLLENIP